MTKAAEIRKFLSTNRRSSRITDLCPVGDIVIAEYSPRRPDLEQYRPDRLKQRLEQWEAQLPKCMQRAPLDETLGPAFWAAQLHMAYQ